MEAGAEADSGHVVNSFGWAQWYPDRSDLLHVAAEWTRDPAVVALLVGVGAEVNAWATVTWSSAPLPRNPD